MADSPAREPPVESTKVAVDGQQENGVPPTGPIEADQTVADSEQTLASVDQAVSDADQTGSERDQADSDSDQLASDRDQAASDRDLAAGGDEHQHEVSRDARQHSSDRRHHTTDVRERTAKTRLAAAEKRDAAADARDLAALARDQAAEARTLAMAQCEAAHEQDDKLHELSGSDAIIGAAGARKRGAQRRVLAAEYRKLAAKDRLAAAKDRQAAAEDREKSALERLRALVDREALAREVALAETDALTGARCRAAGLTDLEHELDRARRTGDGVVVAYVDIDGLKLVNDTQGHDTGDELLRQVVRFMREHLRSYDLIIRVGGDEFVLAMSKITLTQVHKRFDAIADALAAEPVGGAISTGFAELKTGETATDLITRADRELIGNRRARGHSRAQLEND